MKQKPLFTRVLTWSCGWGSQPGTWGRRGGEGSPAVKAPCQTSLLSLEVVCDPVLVREPLRQKAAMF